MNQTNQSMDSHPSPSHGKLVARLIAGRFLQLLLIALAVTAVTFVLSTLIPGDFYTLHQLDPNIRNQTLEMLRHRYHMDRPVVLQYLLWLRNVVRLDLGYSLFYQAPVTPVVGEALLRTCWIGLPALFLGLIGGLIIGTIHAMHRDKRLGRFLDLLSSIALSLPTLVLGLFALLFAARSGWFPLGSMTSANLVAPTLWRFFLDRLHHLALPVACLTIPIMASFERIQYGSVQQTLSDLHVRAARSRGLGRARIFFHHLVRPSLNPALSTFGTTFGAALSGSLILEVIFAWPGLGQITYDALFNRDHFLLLGCVVGSSILLVLGNVIADILLLLLDPRTRTTAEGVEER